MHGRVALKIVVVLLSIICAQLFDLALGFRDRSVLHAQTSALHWCLKSGGSKISGTV